MPDCSHPVFVRSARAHDFVRADRSIADQLGFSDDELAERDAVEWLHPDDQPAFSAALQQDAAELRARHATRTGGWMMLHWTVRRESDGPQLLARPEGKAPTPAALGRKVAGHDSLASLLASMARTVEASHHGKFCSILLVDDEQSRVTVGAGPSLPDEYNAAVEGLEIGPSVGSCGTAAYWNVPVVVENIAKDPLWRNLRQAAASAGVAACWSHPIRSRNGKVLGAMALYDTVPNAPEHHELHALEIAAHMVGLAIEHNRLETQVRHVAKMEALGVLAGGVAHDFNNLLSVIMGNAQMVRTQLRGDDDSRRKLENVLQASETAADLCRQMLAYAGRSARTPETFDCNAMILELQNLLQVSLSKKARLTCALPGELLVTADRSQMRQVILNLITNGAEAVGDREGEVAVSTRTMTVADDSGPREMIEIKVRDTGRGMDEETKAKIFDPFFSTKSEGRGLGLAAVKGIIESHDWNVRVDSQPGHGTTFTVLAPREHGAAPTRMPRPKRAAPTSARVLVVDDEPAVLQVVSQMLEMMGMEALPASGGEQAIEIYQRDRDIDCVILDLSMPHLDGGEVYARLKKFDPNVRVIVTSGFAEQDILDRFRGAELFGILPKPVRERDLEEVLGLALGNAKDRAPTGDRDRRVSS